jgi:hypothetical protein
MYLPRLCSTAARLFILLSVDGCSWPFSFSSNEVSHERTWFMDNIIIGFHSGMQEIM